MNANETLEDSDYCAENTGAGSMAQEQLLSVLGYHRDLDGLIGLCDWVVDLYVRHMSQRL